MCNHCTTTASKIVKCTRAHFFLGTMLWKREQKPGRGSCSWPRQRKKNERRPDVGPALYATHTQLYRERTSARNQLAAKLTARLFGGKYGGRTPMVVRGQRLYKDRASRARMYAEPTRASAKRPATPARKQRTRAKLPHAVRKKTYRGRTHSRGLCTRRYASREACRRRSDSHPSGLPTRRR